MSKVTKSAIVAAAESACKTILNGRPSLPVEALAGRDNLVAQLSTAAGLKILITATNQSEVDAYFSNLPVMTLVEEINTEDSPRWVKMSRSVALGAYERWVEEKADKGQMTSEMNRLVKMIPIHNEFEHQTGRRICEDKISNF